MTKFIHSSRRQHKFAGCDPGNGRFVHFDSFCDLPENQRFHGLVAPFEEGGLAADDRASHLEQGVISHFNAFDQPAGLLQLRPHRSMFPRDMGRVLGVDPEAGYRP